MDVEGPYREHGHALLAYLCARLPRAVAEDVHHDVWLAAWRRPDALTGVALRRWLFRVARNAMLDFLRKPSTRREKTGVIPDRGQPGETSELDSLIAKELVAALRRCVEELEEPFRVVVKGRLAGKSPDDLAQELGINRATVDTRYHKAKAKLATCTGAEHQ